MSLRGDVRLTFVGRSLANSVSFQASAAVTDFHSAMAFKR